MWADKICVISPSSFVWQQWQCLPEKEWEYFCSATVLRTNTSAEWCSLTLKEWTAWFPEWSISWSADVKPTAWWIITTLLIRRHFVGIHKEQCVPKGSVKCAKLRECNMSAVAHITPNPLENMWLEGKYHFDASQVTRGAPYWDEVGMC